VRRVIAAFWSARAAITSQPLEIRVILNDHTRSGVLYGRHLIVIVMGCEDAP